MTTEHTRQIALSGPLLDWANGEVARGEHSSISELIRVAMRQLMGRDEVQRSFLLPRQADELRA